MFEYSFLWLRCSQVTKCDPWNRLLMNGWKISKRLAVTVIEKLLSFCGLTFAVFSSWIAAIVFLWADIRSILKLDCSHLFWYRRLQKMLVSILVAISAFLLFGPPNIACILLVGIVFIGHFEINKLNISSKTSCSFIWQRTYIPLMYMCHTGVCFEIG